LTLRPSSLAQPAAACLLALATLACAAQTPAIPAPVTPPSFATPPPIPLNRTVIVLDPAHGGVDSGSRITDKILEKDVDLSFAFKLRTLLAARGFSVVMTRDNDTASQPGSPGTPLSLDDRAGIANHAHPVACLLLHATAAGNGVHLYSSELDPTPGEPPSNPWLTAQAAWVNQSQHLQKLLASALTRASIPLVQSRASVRPVDSLTCPALVIELATDGGDADSLADDTYQQRVAEAIASALIFWKTQAQPPDRLTLDQLPATTTGPKP
jgi:N-acetylmuramoyl-L-alanine amidase